jgi:hypothetical protein
MKTRLSRSLPLFLSTALHAEIILLKAGRCVKLLLAFASKVIPGFSLLEIHNQKRYSLLDMCMCFEMFVLKVDGTIELVNYEIEDISSVSVLR